MISDFQAVFAATVALLRVEMTLYGFSFSWWEVFLWSIIAGLVIWFIKEIRT